MGDSSVVEKNLPCEDCGSSDAVALYDDGHTYCFSCSAHKGGKTNPSERREAKRVLGLIEDVEYKALNARGLDKDTCEKFRYGVGRDMSDRLVQIAHYYSPKGELVAQKLRYPDKEMPWTGEPKKAGLFGMQLWSPGGKQIAVTEGEIDAMSLSQAQGNRWPVVSIKNGAQGAKKELAQHIEYLESFGRVVLMFDMDDVGQAAARECAELFTPGKCAIAQLPVKDANDMLKAGRVKELVSAFWQAKTFRPDGLVEGTDLWATVTQPLEQGLPYPWPSLNKLTYGQREREIVCWTAGTGIGKSQFLREVFFDLTQRHGQRVGIISLEESVRSAALGQLSLAAGKRLHIPEVRAFVGQDELRKYYDNTLGTGLYTFYDHFGSVDASSLLPKIRFMALGCGVKWILLDHISIMVSGMATEGDERKRIDELMTKLRTLVEELNIGVHFISHLRKADGKPHEEGGAISLQDLRGSGAIAQVSNMVIGVERNQQAVKEDHRNTTRLRVLKNRFSGETGRTSGLILYSRTTGRLAEVEIDLEPSDVAAETEKRSDF